MNWWVVSEDYYLLKLGVSLSEMYNTEAQATVIRNWVAQFSKDYIGQYIGSTAQLQLEYLTVKNPEYRKAIMDLQVEIMRSTLFVGGLQEMMKVRDRINDVAPSVKILAYGRNLFARYYHLPSYIREDYLTERATW
jgi:hypothetical protein